MSLVTDFFVYPFLFKALLAGIMLAFIAGILSPIVVAKRMAIIGEGIGHSTFFTSTLALLVLGGSFESDQLYFWLVIIFTLILSLFLAKVTDNKSRPIDSIIAAYLSITLSLGMIIHSFNPNQNYSMVDLLFGNILMISSNDLRMLVIIVVALLVVLKKYIWSIIYYTYDEQSAILSNIPVKKIHYILILTMTLFIVCAVKLVGPILVGTMLVIPGLFARNCLKGRVQLPFKYSIFHCIGSTILGLILSNYFQGPPGAMISLAHFPFFVIFKVLDRKNK